MGKIAAAPAKSKTCLNPNCQKLFLPGHYRDRQKVGSDATHVTTIKCPKCKGAGEWLGFKCHRCGGKGQIRQTCQEWYKGYWSQTRKPPRGIPDEIFKKLERAAREDQLRHACMIAARESGLRKGELLGLTWGGILEPGGGIRPTFDVRGQWDDRVGFKRTKTGESRIGYFLPEAVAVLKKLPKGAPDERVFPFYESAIYEWFVGLQIRLGIKNPETGQEFRWHDLRHSLGTELVHGNGDRGLAIAQAILGHKNIQTTIGYSKKGDREILAEAIQLRKGGK